MSHLALVSRTLDVGLLSLSKAADKFVHRMYIWLVQEGKRAGQWSCTRCKGVTNLLSDDDEIVSGEAKAVSASLFTL